MKFLSKKNSTSILAISSSALALAGCSTFGANSPANNLDEYLKPVAQSDEFAGRSPNVVFFFVDDMGYGDLSCYGNKSYMTKNLDRMAGEGMLFKQFYVAQPVSGASRAGLLTGTYPNRIGMHGAPDHNARHGINPNEWTMAQMFRDSGYTTGMAGKWHLGHHREFLPLQHGFDEFYGIPYSNDMWPNHAVRPGFYPDLPLYRGNEVVEHNSDQRFFTKNFTEWGKKFITQNADKPFFLYMAYPMPHVPIFASPEFEGASGAGLYGDVIQEIDWGVGEILAHLKKSGLDENTMVVFTSDNGPWKVYGNHAGSTGGLKGTKGTVYEGGVRVPCIVRMPGVVPAGSVFDKAAMAIDFMPTFAQMVGGRMAGWITDGRSMLDVLLGKSEESASDVYFFYYGKNELQAVLADGFKYYVPHTVRTIRTVGGDGQQGSYIYPRCEYQLYNLAEDPNETVNLIDNPHYSAQLARLQQFYLQASEDMGNSLTNTRGKNTRRPAEVKIGWDRQVTKLLSFDSDYNL
ncbi:MAG: sulfatase [Spirochaetales bacterium]|nr:sulfatase [Spirochaetales bacterium]